MSRSHSLRVYLLAFLAWALAFFADLRLGAVEGAALDLVMQLRLPRALLASGVGAGLAVAGTLLQALFTNPLCEPYTLGISSGSALGAVIAASLGIEAVFAGMAGSAFAGALLFAGALFAIAQRARTGQSTLLLAGVMLGFLGSSLVSLWMALSDPNGIQGVLFWLLGDLSRARLEGAIATGLGVIGLSLLTWRSSLEMDALLMGEEGARSLGISVEKVRRKLIVLSSLLVALCVSAAGMIGFVGLVVPHLGRKLTGSLHLKLVPLAALLGAATLTAADCLARVAARPYDLPVGVVTALLGAPVFLLVLLKEQG